MYTQQQQFVASSAGSSHPLATSIFRLPPTPTQAAFPHARTRVHAHTRPYPLATQTSRMRAGTGQSLQERVTDFGTTFRWSAGAGLALPTWFGRFEANYVVVLSQQENDRVKRGLQLGFASSVFM